MPSEETIRRELTKELEKGNYPYRFFTSVPIIKNTDNYDSRYENGSYNKHLKSRSSKLICGAVDSFFMEDIKEIKRKSLLDIGTGNGTRIHRYDGLFDKITGIDPSRKGIEIAREKIRGDSEYEFKQGEFGSIEGIYDAVTSLFSVFSILSEEQIEERFKQVYDALDKGGRFYFDVAGRRRHEKNQKGEAYKYYAYFIQNDKGELTPGKDGKPTINWAMSFTMDEIMCAENVGFNIEKIDSFHLTGEKPVLNSNFSKKQLEKRDKMYKNMHYMAILQK